jgi:hypothetical protein
VRAGHLGQWSAASRYRGYHQVVYTVVQELTSDEEPVFEQHFMLHNPNPIPDVIGAYLVRDHVRQQELLGARLSENAVALDIGMHIRGSGHDANQFVNGYAAGADEDLLSVLEQIGPDDVEAITVPREHFGIGVPARHYRAYQRDSAVLDFAVCTSLLQNDEDHRRDLAQRWKAAAAGGDALTAIELAGEAADVDPVIAANARELFLRAVADLVAAERFSDIEAVVDASEPWLEAMLGKSEQGWVRALRLPKMPYVQVRLRGGIR